MNRSEILPSDEVREAGEEGDEAGVAADEEHGSVAHGHDDEEMETGGGAEGEVGQNRPGEGGVKVAGERPGDDPPHEAHRNRGHEAEKETEDGNGDPDRRRHRFHTRRHGNGRLRDREAAIRLGLRSRKDP